MTSPDSERTPQHDDEFQFFASDAARVGRAHPLPEVERVIVDVTDGRRIAGIRYGTGAPEVVFLHGMGLNAHGFDPVALADGRPGLALDLPGHGRSDWRDDAEYRPDLLATDVVAALSQLAPEPFDLIGHSLGGLTAIVTASMIPERVQGLAIIDITPGVVPKHDASSITEFISGKREFDSIDEMVDRAIAYGIGSDRTALTRGVTLNSRRRADGKWEWAHHFAHLDGLPTPADSAAAADSAAPAGTGDAAAPPLAMFWEPLSALHAAGMPIVQIRGSEGIVTDELALEWEQKLPGSSVLTVPGPHNLHEASPVELAAAIRSLK